jgi:hypothetical protein
MVGSPGVVDYVRYLKGLFVFPEGKRKWGKNLEGGIHIHETYCLDV